MIINIPHIINGRFHLSVKKFFLFKKLPITDVINKKNKEKKGAEARKNIPNLKLKLPILK
jgi:hypothetical protein